MNLKFLIKFVKELLMIVERILMQRESLVAVVTGANRGIGLEVVRQLARRGMRVVLGSRNLEKGEVAARSLTREGATVFPRQLDVTDEVRIDRLLRDVTAEFGK